MTVKEKAEILIVTAGKYSYDVNGNIDSKLVQEIMKKFGCSRFAAIAAGRYAKENKRKLLRLLQNNPHQFK